MHPLRSLILAAAGSDTIRRAVTRVPVTRNVVWRFVAGESTQDAVAAARGLVAAGLTATLDYLGEDTTDEELAGRTADAYVELLDAVAAAGLAQYVEVSVKLSAVGQLLDEELALANARRVCAAAASRGTTVTLDMEDHTTTDSTLRVLMRLRREWPWVGAVLQAYLRRTAADAAALAMPDSRVRLCKGAYAEPADVAFPDRHHVDLNYVRCVNTLLSGDGYPMFATHDPRLVEIVADRASHHGRKADSFEFQMLYGVRPAEQRRLAELGHVVRVYVPYGTQWYGYLMRRLAERPANTGLFLRSLVSHT
ncbi:proline dehydrogenase family protein [Actinophytocola sp.]|uniref:proline dehydrogenase family protein n=1 Tax=Actinophytocola sp. TaxID=1872138 RepID=UPI003D6BD5B6